MENKKVKKVIVFAVMLLVIFLYGQYMKAENRRLLQDLSHLNQRVKRLERDNNMQRIVDLRAQNAILKDMIQKLQGELFKLRQEKAACEKKLDARSPGRKEPKSVLSKEKEKVARMPLLPAKGNRGYLFKK